MSKAALVIIDRKIEEERKTSGKFIKTQKEMALQEARDEIASLHSAATLPVDGGWISVEDRFPGVNGKYICCASHIWDDFSFEAYFKKKSGFWNGNSGRSSIEVTHWREFPLPPTK